MEETNIDSYNADLLSELRKTSILDSADAVRLEGCMPFIINSINTAQMFRTDTEMRVSVLNDIKHPTPDSKYWQIMREASGMAASLFQLNFEFRKKSLDLELLEDDLVKMKSALYPGTASKRDEIEAKKKEIDIEKTRFELVMMQREAHHRIREISEWRAIAMELEPNLMYGTEDVNLHQKLSYAVQFCKEIQSHFATGATYSPAESRNMMGLLITTIREVHRTGMLDKFQQEIDGDHTLKEFLSRNNIIKMAIGTTTKKIGGPKS